MSTPRDFNQRPQWWDRPTPQQGGIPWYQQPVNRPSPPQSPQQPSAPYPGAGQYRTVPAPLRPPAQRGQPSTGSSTSKSRPSGSKSNRFVIGAAIIAVLIVGVVAVLMVSGGFKHDTKKVAVAGVQSEVQQVLVDRITGYSAGDIKDVKCNNGQDPTVKKGQSFTCDVNVRGKQHQLTVTFQDDNGTYAVGLPQLGGGK